MLDRFQTHTWPGNVRELQGVVKQAMLNASGHLILPEFLPEHLTALPAKEAAATPDAGAALDVASLIDALLPEANGRLHEEVVAAVERLLFVKVLQHVHGNQARASELLGLNRSTLRHRLRALGLALGKVPVDTAKKAE